MKIFKALMKNVYVYIQRVTFFDNENIDESYLKRTTFHKGFGREKDENHADLCLRSIVFFFESGCL